MKLKYTLCQCRSLARCMPPHWCFFLTPFEVLPRKQLTVPLATFNEETTALLILWFSYRKIYWSSRKGFMVLSSLSLAFNYNYRKFKRFTIQRTVVQAVHLSPGTSSSIWHCWHGQRWLLQRLWQCVPLKKLITVVATQITHTHKMLLFLHKIF